MNKIDKEQTNQCGESETDDAAFFSFRISIVIPSWPSRFAAPEFSKVMESIIRDDAPAQIGIEFSDLDFTVLEQFEKWYRNRRRTSRKVLPWAYSNLLHVQ